MKQRKIDDKLKSNHWYVRLGHWFSEIPLWGWIFALAFWPLNHIFYMLAGPIGKGMSNVYGWKITGNPAIWDPTNPDCWHWSGWTPKTAVDDAMFPLCIEFWAFVYVTFAFFVTFAALVVAKTSKKNYVEFFVTSLSCWLLGALVMGFAPSYMSRGAEGVMDRINNHNDVWAKMYKWIFSPHGYENSNLAPSFHWLTTGLAMWFACKDRDNGVNKPLKVFIIAWSVLIFISTLYTKHHYFIDGVMAVGVIVVVWPFFHFFKVSDKIINKCPWFGKAVSMSIPDIYHANKKKRK